MELDNFILKTYSDINPEHENIILELCNDEKSMKYIGELKNLIQTIKRRKDDDYRHNNFYIAYYNNRPIGFIALTHNKDEYEIISSLLKKERGTKGKGNHIASLLLQEFSEKIFETYPNIKKLTLKIKNDNIASIKTAELGGYTKEKDGIYILEEKGEYINSHRK